ncbi:MAG: gliding motility-associated C-terminal domain-containing protein [Chitinophagales bacterium]
MQKLFAFFTILFVKLSLFSTDIKPELDFVQNKGQWETPVLYKADLKGGWVFLEKDELTYLFYDNSTIKHAHEKKGNSSPIFKGHVYKVKWLNANPNSTITESEQQEYYNNYFIGSDQSKWQSEVGLFRIIDYKNLYSNIDAKVYSEASSMKTDYIIHPNGNTNDIRLQYDGADNLKIDENGKLKITTSVNDVYELKPYAYQIKNGVKVEVICKYKLTGNVVSFVLPNGYNKNVDLIIDPTIIFSTYSGSFGDNWGSSATHDNNGNMFLGGIVLESGFPTTTGAFQTTFGGGTQSPNTLTTGSDVVITKLNATGTTRLFSTYLGGSSNEILASLICTPSNELIAVMPTSSSNFPTTLNAYDRTFNGGAATEAVEIYFPNGSDLAITKFNANGTALLGSTFFGGTGNDGLNLNDPTLFNYGDESRSDVALDNAGNIYVVSTTESNNIPGTTNKAQPAYGGGNADGMLAKFNATLSSLSWATYYGGSGTDAAYSIGLDNANNIFICGGTTSANIPGRSTGVNTAYMGGNCDGFVAKFDNNGNAVQSASYLGTSAYDQGFILDLDKNNNVYVFGQTLGTYPVTAGVYSNTNAKQFIHKLSNNLSTTGFSTVFGRANYNFVNISPTALLIDVCSNIYAVGWGGAVNTGNGSSGTGYTFNMPLTANALQSTTDGSDFYLINLGVDASSLIYASYLGENNSSVGDHVDGGTSRFDKNGVVYQAICGSCGATQGFPVTPGVVSTTNNSSNCNMVGVKYKFDLQALQIVSVTATPPRGCAPLSVNFSYTSTKPGTSFFWDFGDGTNTTTEFPSHTYNNPGTYTCKFIIRNPQDCNPVDSAFVTVVVAARSTGNITRTICQGRSTVFNGQTLTQAGTYRDTVTNSSGCDSIIVLTLVVNPSKTTNTTRNICQGQSTGFNGQTLTQAGTYRDTLLQQNGCDSFIVMTLVVNQPKTTNITRQICQGQTTVFNGQTLSQAGTYRDTLQTSAGCDSFIVLNLSVSAALTTTITRVICQGQSVTVGQHTYNASGNYKDTLRSVAGCDSIVTLNLTVNPAKVTNLSQNICQGQSVQIGQHVYTTTGNYKDTLRTTLGCDSIVNLALTVTNQIFNNIARSICEGQSVTVANHTYNQTGSYKDTLRSAAGCDSIITLNLVVNPKKSTSISRAICQGQTFTVGTHVYSQAGNYKDTLRSSAGCDSVVNLTLQVNPNVRSSIDRTICEGENVVIGNQTFNTTGTFTVVLQTSQGCDSTVILNLLVNPKKVTNLSQEICEGDRVVIGNSIYTTTGNYSDTFRTSLDCDSVVNLNLIVNPKKFSDLNLTICTGKSVTIGGQTFTVGGNYPILFQSSKGCDSTVNLHLVFSDTIVENITRTICEGDTLTVENQIFTQAGNYVINLKAFEGCDSVVNLNLIVINTVRENVQRTICEGQTTTIGTETFSIAGTYTVLLTAVSGCDSIVLLDLKVNPKKSTQIDSTICQGNSVTIGNHTYTQTGNYIDTLTSSQGCDSTVFLNLVVNPLPVIDAIVDNPLVEAGTQVQLNVTTAETLNYNWTPATVSNANIQNPTAIVNVPTWFVVQATNPQTLCKNIDSVFVGLKVIPCSKDNVFIPTAFSPNNDGNNDVFLVRSRTLASGKLLIFDRWGNKVFESDDMSIGWNGTYKNQPAQLEVYGYYFVGDCLDGERITLKGNVTLVR